MLFIQFIFLIRDNLASRLAEGAVTSLTYGWMIQQVPETLIGTAIGTAMLPTLSEFFSKQDQQAFSETISKAVRVILALTLPMAAALALGLKPLLGLAFDFGEQGTSLLAWVTAAFLAGLFGHSLKEVSARSFYARQNAPIPLLTAAGNAVLYALIGSLLYRPLGAPGIALTDSLVFTLEAVVLLLLLRKISRLEIRISSTWLRAALALVVAGGVTWGISALLQGRVSALILGTLPIIAGFFAAAPLVWQELKLLLKL
jgi:putative peptidoglycan lipid II flippase